MFSSRIYHLLWDASHAEFKTTPANCDAVSRNTLTAVYERLGGTCEISEVPDIELSIN